MIAALVLDLLLFLVPLMLIPLGLWRGGPHEGYVGGGVLLGWVVGDNWAGAWSGPLAQLTHANDGAMRLLVAFVLLVIGAGIGHLAGSVVGLPRPGADARIAGALLAWLNGVLFLTLALGAYRDTLAGKAPSPVITRGFLTEFVIDHERWVLLGVAIVVLGLIGTVLWVNAAIGELYDPAYVPGTRTVFSEMPPPPPLVDQERLLRDNPMRPIAEPYSSWPVTNRNRGITVPRAADAGKVEPAPSRFRSALSRIGAQPTPPRPSRAVLDELFARTMPVDLRPPGQRDIEPERPTGDRSGEPTSDRDRPDSRSASPRHVADEPIDETPIDGSDDHARIVGPEDAAAGASRDAAGASPGAAPAGTEANPNLARYLNTDLPDESGRDGPSAPDRARGVPHMARTPHERQRRDDADAPTSIGEWLRVASGMTNPMIRDASDAPSAQPSHGDQRPESEGSAATDRVGDAPPREDRQPGTDAPSAGDEPGDEPPDDGQSAAPRQ